MDKSEVSEAEVVEHPAVAALYVFMIKPHIRTVTFSKMQNVNDSLNWGKMLTNYKL